MDVLSVDGLPLVRKHPSTWQLVDSQDSRLSCCTEYLPAEPLEVVMLYLRQGSHLNCHAPANGTGVIYWVRLLTQVQSVHMMIVSENP